MKNSIQKIWRSVSLLGETLANSALCFCKKGQRKQLYQLIHSSLQQYSFHLNKLLGKANTHTLKGIFRFDGPYADKWHKHAFGLHSLLPPNSKYCYSLLTIIDEANLSSLEPCLLSMLKQTAPNYEILVGLLQKPSTEVQSFLGKLQKEHPGKLKLVTSNTKNKSSLYNLLSKEASGNYFIFCESSTILRPDLTFRFEQVLRLHQDAGNLVLYSDEYVITKKKRWTQGHPFSRSESLHFPFLFHTLLPECFLIPKAFWEQIKEFNETFESAFVYDLFLRLDSIGAEICKIPIPLYACHERSEIEKEAHLKEFQTALKEYTQKKGLNWQIEKGLCTYSLRSIPSLKKKPAIHALIPFKDQKAMTLVAAQSLLKQEGINIQITAINNRSSDTSIALELEQLGVEVIHVDGCLNGFGTSDP